MRPASTFLSTTFVFSLALSTLGVAACSDTFGTSSSGGGAQNPDGGVVAGGGKNPPPGCDGAAAPDQNPCVVDDGVGIFASVGMGQDNADGSHLHPVKSLQKAIDLAKAAGNKNVYACSETFQESLTLHSGVSVYGYFDCSTPDWKVAADRHALLQAPTSPAVTATDIVDPTVFVAFDVIAPDATKTAPSSIAVLAKNASSLRIARGKYQSGKGYDGADGVEGTQLVDSPTKDGAAGLLESTCQLGVVACNANGGDCNDAACYQPHANGVAGGTNACTGAPGHAGGAGGAGGGGGHWQKYSTDNCHKFTYVAFYDGATVLFATPGNGGAGSGGAAGGTARYDDQSQSSPTTSCGQFEHSNGVDGTAGGGGTDGASATTPGTFNASGFTPADGTAGANGSPGTGGGGGAGSLPLNAGVYGDGALTWGIVGAGGGAGGCPGLAGTPGKGGGASIVILATDSGMQLDGLTLQAGNGGRGGAGTFGSNATSGGNAGFAPEPGPNSSDPLAGNSAGGRGGDGGRSGVSGAGAGGSSIAVAYHGAMPNLVNGTTATPGNAGQGQTARTHADGVRTIPASADGAAVATLQY